LLQAWAGGDRDALEQLTPRVYTELRKMAGGLMNRERQERTLQATGLVHEAYLRLVDIRGVSWEHRAHFFAIAAQVMRRILLEQARQRATAKRGGGLGRVDLNEVPDLSGHRDRELIALDEALEGLAQIDPRKARVIELRFFGGLSVQETAAVLKVSEDTVLRDWRLARGWLLSEIEKG
jgi:RNA polymerase sigma factor (TIGR02999 family)